MHEFKSCIRHTRKALTVKHTQAYGLSLKADSYLKKIVNQSGLSTSVLQSSIEFSGGIQ